MVPILLRLKLDERGCTRANHGDYFDQSEKREMRLLQSALLARGFLVDLHTLHDAWSERSQEWSASWLDCRAYESDVDEVLKQLEPDAPVDGGQ